MIKKNVEIKEDKKNESFDRRLQTSNFEVKFAEFYSLPLGYQIIF